MTRFPNVSESVKEASVRTLRAVFAGIGHVLLVSDRARRRLKSAPGADGAPQKAAPDTVRIPVTRPTAVKTAAEASVEPDAKTAKVPTAKAAGKARRAPAKATAAPAARASAAPAALAAAKAPTGAKAPATAETPAKPPIPNYDELSFASLRARLRGRDVAQVRQLLSYEKARGSRSDVITMYERRIAKLTETDG